MLRGRRRECAALDGVIEAARAGESRVLVLRGEAGMGKTALLEYAVQRASGFRVVRAVGVESEMELPYAALHQLCAPVLDRLDRLPGPQRRALGTAFGLSAGAAPDRFLVGLAALSLLGEVAEEGPLVCVVDDAQWLDRASEQALAFVARRLLAESVAILFGVREPGAEPALAGLPELAVEGLRHHEARGLLESVISGPLDAGVRERILAETHGNPLALLELPRGLTAAELAGGFGLPDAASLPTRIEASFLRRIERMPSETRRLLLIAAAEPSGDPALLWTAAGRLGVDVDRAVAGAEGLIARGARVSFRHPLVRSAVYRVTAPAERRTVHAALADSIPPGVDPDRRAWHHAHAAAGPDEAVAAELEASADRAQARGGLAAAAAFLERAVALTPDPGRRARRALAAARAAHASGAADGALALLALARAGPVAEVEDARRRLLEAEIAFSTRRGRDAASLLVAAAQRLEPLDVALARASYLEAIVAASFAGHLGTGAGQLEVSAAIRAASPAPEPRSPADLMRDGLATRFVKGYAAGAPTLQRALRDFRRDGRQDLGDITWVWLAVDLWDDDAWFDLGTRQVQLSREAGALTVLPLALHTIAAWHLLAGEFAYAETLLAEADSIVRATGDAPMSHARLALAALQGRDAETLIATSIRDATARGEGVLVRHAEHASAILNNGLGRYDDAREAAAQEIEHNPAGFYLTALPELVEAAVRSDHLQLARGAVARLREQTGPSGTRWARGIEARSRALLTEGDEADALYRQAIDLLDGSRLGVEHARAQLLYGEWLRRERRRRDARAQLRPAHERFTAMGARPFAERAARELLATGETARKRSLETSGHLTAQEGQIARLAGAGLSNTAIGSQLFISPRTVEYHLHKVFAKLDISSRTQLSHVLDGDLTCQ